MSAKIRADMFGASADLPRIIELDIQQVEANPDQPRKFFDESALMELAQSIEAKGLLQPVLVKVLEGERYMIVAGERRLRAHQLLSRPTIAAVITEGDTDEVAIIENVQRENLRPMELAESLGRLMETHGYTQEDAAKVIGKARNTVTELLSLLKLPEAIEVQCRTSDIASKSFLVELARMDAEAMQEAWHTLKTTGQASVRAARARKAGEPLKEDKRSDTPFQKAERALWIAVKTLESSVESFDKSEKQKLSEIKKLIDNLI
ncbi:Chromosome-partitioning protein Spo0J [Curvibacter sp. AEP1-3]|uniref:ParB/RepB/Spo0J family partition protein n=1 Tax=Curvibacter sp. AEP1-3 TaxID=1844971 RepID=UPI000B5772E8|nr:ParB/RepB/Spo0J family partition protein [Curvibacter sp. AEP1-3]ARV20622.1 Chromosome-partitioning protein Spo0J [Curvibacter sp. AEP1-3]